MNGLSAMHWVPFRLTMQESLSFFVVVVVVVASSISSPADISSPSSKNTDPLVSYPRQAL